MNRRAIQVVDLGFGDAGKGTMIDYLARRHEADLVVRFNGGPQAGHNVVLPDGRHHTFAQFGSASFVAGVKTLLSHYMLIEPYAMLNEAAHLESLGVTDALARTFIDERCQVITPPHQVANRIRERARGPGAHGTCGMGVGECVADSLDHPQLTLRAADLRDRATARRKLGAILEHKRSQLKDVGGSATADEQRVLDDPAWIEAALDAYSQIAQSAEIVPDARANELLRTAACALFEGAQGVLLDERYGFHPHTTWSKTTFTNADALLDECQSIAIRQRVGVLRTYLTRHGAGPFTAFDDPVQQRLLEPHNSDLGWQGLFRRGPLDLVLLRYALRACGGVHGLAITHLDRLLHLPPNVCHAYRMDGRVYDSLPNPPAAFQASSVDRLDKDWPTDNERAAVDFLAKELGTPVLYRSHGPTWMDKSGGCEKPRPSHSPALLQQLDAFAHERRANQRNAWVINCPSGFVQADQ